MRMTPSEWEFNTRATTTADSTAILSALREASPSPLATRYLRHALATGLICARTVLNSLGDSGTPFGDPIFPHHLGVLLKIVIELLPGRLLERAADDAVVTGGTTAATTGDDERNSDALKNISATTTVEDAHGTNGIRMAIVLQRVAASLCSLRPKCLALAKTAEEASSSSATMAAGVSRQQHARNASLCAQILANIGKNVRLVSLLTLSRFVDADGWQCLEDAASAMKESSLTAVATSTVGTTDGGSWSAAIAATAGTDLCALAMAGGLGLGFGPVMAEGEGGGGGGGEGDLTQEQVRKEDGTCRAKRPASLETKKQSPLPSQHTVCDFRILAHTERLHHLTHTPHDRALVWFLACISDDDRDSPSAAKEILSGCSVKVATTVRIAFAELWRVALLALHGVVVPPPSTETDEPRSQIHERQQALAFALAFVPTLISEFEGLVGRDSLAASAAHAGLSDALVAALPETIAHASQLLGTDVKPLLRNISTRSSTISGAYKEPQQRSSTESRQCDVMLPELVALEAISHSLFMPALTILKLAHALRSATASTSDEVQAALITAEPDLPVWATAYGLGGLLGDALGQAAQTHGLETPANVFIVAVSLTRTRLDLLAGRRVTAANLVPGSEDTYSWCYSSEAAAAAAASAESSAVKHLCALFSPSSSELLPVDGGPLGACPVRLLPYAGARAAQAMALAYTKAKAGARPWATEFVSHGSRAKSSDDALARAAPINGVDPITCLLLVGSATYLAAASFPPRRTRQHIKGVIASKGGELREEGSESSVARTMSCTLHRALAAIVSGSDDGVNQKYLLGTLLGRVIHQILHIDGDGEKPADTGTAEDDISTVSKEPDKGSSHSGGTWSSLLEETNAQSINGARVAVSLPDLGMHGAAWIVTKIWHSPSRTFTARRVLALVSTAVGPTTKSVSDALFQALDLLSNASNADSGCGSSNGARDRWRALTSLCVNLLCLLSAMTARNCAASSSSAETAADAADSTRPTSHTNGEVSMPAAKRARPAQPASSSPLSPPQQHQVVEEPNVATLRLFEHFVCNTLGGPDGSPGIDIARAMANCMIHIMSYHLPVDIFGDLRAAQPHLRRRVSLALRRLGHNNILPALYDLSKRDELEECAAMCALAHLPG